MSITLLRTLIAVADSGSFAAASQRVHVSQAAVGQQMRKLEADLGVTLFDRRGRSPRLTDLGEAVATRARGVVHSYDGLLNGLIAEAALIGELTVGALPSQIRALLPLSIKRLLARYPGLHTRVVSGLNEELQEAVERGTQDAAILSRPAHLPHGLTFEPFADEAYVLITGADVAGNDPREILTREPYIRHQRRAVAGQLADAWLTEQGIAVQPTMELQSLEALANMVAHGLGVSVVPDPCVPDETFADLRRIPLPGKAPVRTLGILTRADCPKLALVAALAEEIHRTAHKSKS